jgi:predicted nucleic acid-binding Zn ribbon protein
LKAVRRRKGILDGPTDISVILTRILDAPEVKSHLADVVLVTRWPEVVGETVASKVKLVDFRDGMLTLHAESATWRSEVNFAKKAILDRFNVLLGKPVAKEIRFV